MEDVLDLYAEPPDPKRPRVCVDELPYQLVAETRTPVPAATGRRTRVDYEYERKGTCNLFLLAQPEAGWRHVEVTDRRTGRDFAEQLRALVDVHFPAAERIRVVLDNLNTHTPATLYEAFAPEEARRLARRLEFHYTPKHGSWLNMAEVELSVLSGQCLGRRIPDTGMLRSEVLAWEERRNSAHATIDWRFTAADARVKLHRLYPS
jgi:DDE superfamily endonuclease